MYWLIVLFAAVVALWSFIRCGRLLRRLQLINQAAEETLSDVRELMAECTDKTLAREAQRLHDAVVFTALESNMKLSSGKYKDAIWKRWRKI